MKIVDKTTKVVIFEKIGFYETFMHGGEPYMKIDDCYVGTEEFSCYDWFVRGFNNCREKIRGVC